MVSFFLRAFGLSLIFKLCPTSETDDQVSQGTLEGTCRRICSGCVYKVSLLLSVRVRCCLFEVFGCCLGLNVLVGGSRVLLRDPRWFWEVRILGLRVEGF